jgi:hypothetical protein
MKALLPLESDAWFLGRVFAQMVAVSVLICTAALIVDALGFWSRWNLLWVMGIPFVISRSFYRKGWAPAIAGFCLVPWSLLSLFVAIAWFTIEP